MRTLPKSTRAPVTLRGITYDVYLQIRDAPGNDQRLTYYNGTLEVMSPTEYRHEKGSSRLALIVRAYAAVFDMDCEGSRSTTFRKGYRGQMKGHGKEPDESFYIAHAGDIRDNDSLELTSDPPPDLWIEVDNRGSSLGRLPLYAAFGVPEVWRYRPRRKKLWFGRLEKDCYISIEHSLSLPKLTPEIVLTLLDEARKRGETAWDRWMRNWMDATLRRMDI